MLAPSRPDNSCLAELWAIASASAGAIPLSEAALPTAGAIPRPRRLDVDCELECDWAAFNCEEKQQCKTCATCGDEPVAAAAGPEPVAAASGPVAATTPPVTEYAPPVWEPPPDDDVETLLLHADKVRHPESAIRQSTPVGNSAHANPFANGGHYYTPVSYRESVGRTLGNKASEAADEHTRAVLEALSAAPVAVWVDRKSKIRGAAGTNTMQGALTAASRMEAPRLLVVFVLYNLPNRDCDANASDVEICCARQRADGDGDGEATGGCDYLGGGLCEAGLQEYAREFIDEAAALLKAFESRVPIALIIEPDSLPNLVTNTAHPNCGSRATASAYEQGIVYAVNQIRLNAPRVTLYLDAGHGGWMGWREHAQHFGELIDRLGIAPSLRGFATNIANYRGVGTACPSAAFAQPLHEYCGCVITEDDPPQELPCTSHEPCCRDPCGMLSQYSDGNNELNYVAMLRQELKRTVRTDFHFIIDTSRDGVDDMRSDCNAWCNVRGAGLGLWPTSDTALPEIVDAYYFVKTPGESDGCSDPSSSLQHK